MTKDIIGFEYQPSGIGALTHRLRGRNACDYRRGDKFLKSFRSLQQVIFLMGNTIWITDMILIFFKNDFKGSLQGVNL